MRQIVVDGFLQEAHVELPRPSALDRHERMARDVIEDIAILARLGRDQLEPRYGGFEVWIDGFLFLERRGPKIVSGTETGRKDGRVADHDSRQAIRVVQPGLQRGQAAETVSCDDRVGAEARVLAHTDQFLGKQIAGILLAVAAVAHTAQVDGAHRVAVDEERRNEIPPVGVGTAAVDEKQTRLAGIPPGEIMDGAALHLDLLFAIRCLQRPEEPIRRLGDVLIHANNLCDSAENTTGSNGRPENGRS